MKVFRRVLAGAAFIAMWTAIAISNNIEATGKEIFASAVLAVLAGMVIADVLIEKARKS